MAHVQEAHAPGTAHVIPPANTKLIWRTFWILLFATSIEFIVAFLVGHEYKAIRVAIFLGLTVVKAVYIVGEFMHLKHETKTLIWCIVLPTVFIMWFVVSMLMEGNSIFAAR